LPDHGGRPPLSFRPYPQAWGIDFHRPHNPPVCSAMGLSSGIRPASHRRRAQTEQDRNTTPSSTPGATDDANPQAALRCQTSTPGIKYRHEVTFYVSTQPFSKLFRMRPLPCPIPLLLPFQPRWLSDIPLFETFRKRDNKSFEPGSLRGDLYFLGVQPYRILLAPA